MNNFFNNLKLIHKVNLVFYIFVLLIVVLFALFFIVNNLTVGNLNKKYNDYKQTELYIYNITENLKLLDYLAIQNSLNTKSNYNKKSKKTYHLIMKNLNLLENDEYLKNRSSSIKLIEKIKKRLIGYQDITKSLKGEVDESFEDGMYAVLALSTTSNIISKELAILSNEVQKISDLKAKSVDQYITNIKMMAIGFIVILYLLMFYINSKVVNSILKQLEKLKNEVSSFFDFLSNKRKNIEYIPYTAKDEIAQIGKMIDDNIHVAQAILLRERDASNRIEKQVKEATKEILALNNELEATQREILFTMGAIAEERSKETGEHVKRVANYSLILARLYGLTLEESVLIKNASPMHDIGKLGIPEKILHKPAKLTDEEFEIMKSHSEIGYKMLKHSDRPMLKAASILAYEHHEKWNGQGYPQGLKGEEIHIYSRITAVADVFDALGSERVYKKAWPIKKIVAFFEEEKGKHFDPFLVDLLLDNLEYFLAEKESINSDKLLSSFIENSERVDNILPKI